ncbi:MAG: NADH-quinone oxidoreductase subunit M [Acidimicrobiales bacterium]
MTGVLTLPGIVAASSSSFPVLPILVLLPAIGAVVVASLASQRSDIFKKVAVAVTSLNAILALWMLVEFQVGTPGYQFETEHTWIEAFGISFHFGVDGISLFLVVLTGILFPIALLATDPSHDNKAYFAWLLALEAGAIGVFIALDLFVFFVCFEIVLVPMYFLIGRWGHGNRVYAATKFFLYTMFGSALMLVGILVLVFLSADALGGVTFDLVALGEAQALATNTARWVFLTFALAFAVKVPLFPLHTWLPDAHTEAPTAGSIILAGVMLKLGTYGFVRLGLFLFPEASHYFAPAMVTLGVIGIIYGAVVATMQRDLKRLVAYSSVAHLGFIVLGTFSLTTQGIEGGLLQMVNHGISTGALFILVGWIYERRHTRQISELNGLQKVAPIMAAAFTLVMLSSIGLPGLNGFVGEFLILTGSFLTARWWTVVATAGVILAALYLLWAYQRVFHGTPKDSDLDTPDLSWREGLVLAPLLFLIVFMGIYPKPVLERMEPSVDALLAHVEAVTGYEAPEPATPSVIHSAEEGGHGDEEPGHGEDEEGE